MKFNLKMIAAAVAMVSAVGSANADLVDPATGNGSLVLVAFNTATRDYYIRDLGFLINSFMPNSVTTLPGDGAVTGTRTPAAGLLLNGGASSPNFTDASFSAWLGSQTQSDIRWMVSAADQTANSGLQSVRRIVVSSINPAETATNGQVDTFANSSNAGGLVTLFGSAGLSMTASGAVPAFDGNFGIGADSLASLNQSAGLFYFARTTYIGGTGTFTTPTQFGNSTGFATVTLEADGDFVYSLAGAPVSEVPVPAAVWLLGSGLIGLGGMVRRRRAAAALA